MTSVEHEIASKAPELRPLLAALDDLHDALDLSVLRQDQRLAQRIFHLITQVVEEIDQIAAPSAASGANADPEVAQLNAEHCRRAALRD
jgi:hypothetical protein